MRTYKRAFFKFIQQAVWKGGSILNGLPGIKCEKCAIQKFTSKTT